VQRSVGDRDGLADQDTVVWCDRQVDLILCETHFYFVKMYYLTHFASMY